jgi:hypothetical protein
MSHRSAAVSAMLVLLTATAMPSRSVAQTDEAEDTPTASSDALREMWQAQRASGIWRSNYFSSSKALDEETGFFGAALQLKAFPSLNERLDGKLEVRISNADVGEGASTRTSLLEGYATVHFDRADLRLGKQIVPWGRADGINPTDNLTPRDYTVLLPFEDDQRFGTTAARVDLFMSAEHTLTLFATPVFEPAKVPLPAAAGGVKRQEPAHTLSNTHGGVRLNKVGEGFDWSLSYFRGFSLLPGVQLIGDAAAPTLQLHYDRITVLGADFARNYGRFGFRGEVAYVDTTDDTGGAPGIRNPYLHWIIGVDRTFFVNLNVNLQFFQRRVRKHRDPQSWTNPAERSTALLNALIDGQRDAITDGISFRVSNKWFNDTLEAEVFAVGHLNRGDGLVRPLVTYAFNDRWKGTVGAELYRGAPNTQFGSLKPNRGAFAELRYGF